MDGGMRWLQARWREVELGQPPGPHREDRPDRLVASMLPLGADRSPNFLSEHALSAAEDRLKERKHSGIVDSGRLFRNLLSSRTLCFTLFGHFNRDPPAPAVVAHHGC